MRARQNLLQLRGIAKRCSRRWRNSVQNWCAAGGVAKALDVNVLPLRFAAALAEIVSAQARPFRRTIAWDGGIMAAL